MTGSKSPLSARNRARMFWLADIVLQLQNWTFIKLIKGLTWNIVYLDLEINRREEGRKNDKEYASKPKPKLVYPLGPNFEHPETNFWTSWDIFWVPLGPFCGPIFYYNINIWYPYNIFGVFLFVYLYICIYVSLCVFVYLCIFRFAYFQLP